METQTFMNPAGGRMMRSLQNDENTSHLSTGRTYSLLLIVQLMHMPISVRHSLKTKLLSLPVPS